MSKKSRGVGAVVVGWGVGMFNMNSGGIRGNAEEGNERHKKMKTGQQQARGPAGQPAGIMTGNTRLRPMILQKSAKSQ